MHHDISPPLRSIPGALVETRKSAVHRQIKEPGSIRRGRGQRGVRLDTAVQDYPSTPTMPLPALNVPRALSRFVTVGGTS